MNLAESNRIIKEFREYHNLKHLTALDEIMLEVFLNFLEKKGYLAEGDEVSTKTYEIRKFYLNELITLLDSLQQRVYHLNFCVSNHLSFSQRIIDIAEFIREKEIEYRNYLLELKKKETKI